MKQLLKGLVGLTLTLSACGPLVAQKQAGSGMRGLLPGSGAQTAQAEDPRQVLTREIIDAAPADLILFGLVAQDIGAVGQLVAENDGKQTWASSDGTSTTLQNGLIIATRGLGDDVMGSDVSGAAAAVRNGSGSTTRIIDFLGSEDQIIRRVYACEYSDLGPSPVEIFDVTHATRQVTETCVGEGMEFINLYWIDSQNIVQQSRQWISPLVGYMDYQLL